MTHDFQPDHASGTYAHWFGKRAKAALPPAWWSVPRDPVDGQFPLAEVPANNRLSRWTVGLFLALACAAFYLASR